MQRELAPIIRHEITDPHLGMITVSGVEVTRDLAHAKVFVSVLGGEGDVEAAMHALQKLAGKIRYRLAHEMRIRTMPELHFVYDESLVRGAKLSALIDEAVAKEDEAKKK